MIHIIHIPICIDAEGTYITNVYITNVYPEIHHTDMYMIYIIHVPNWIDA